MPTPMFKVLAQSLRLGQPPDATTAVRVLVEVIEKQQAELEDLRSKLSIATSRVQYAEARLTRLLEVVESVPARDGQHTPQGHAPQGHAPQGHPQSDQRRSEPPRASQRPPAIPATPAIPKAPRIPSMPAPSLPILHDLLGDDRGQDEMNQTLVISKRDVAQVSKPEAPFPIARASERPRAITRAEGTPFYQLQAQPATGPSQEPPHEEGFAPPSAAPFPAPFQARERQQQPAQRRAMVSEPETHAMDLDVVQGDMTVTEQTARVALAGLNRLEQMAEGEARPRRRDDPDQE